MSEMDQGHINHLADMFAPVIYARLDSTILADKATDMARDVSRRLAQEIEARCVEAQAMGPDARVAVSPLQQDGFSFVHRVVIIEGGWISPEYAGWMIYGPFPPPALAPSPRIS